MFNTIKADQFKVANADSKPELVRLLSDEQIMEFKMALQPSFFTSNLITQRGVIWND